MRDGVVFRSIPLVTSGLTFLPACNGDGDVVSDDTTVADTSDPSGDDDNGTDLPDPTATSDDPTTNEPTESGDPLCGDAGTCGAAAPTGWFGPLVYARVEPGATAPACPPEVGNPGPTVVDGFVDPGPAVCECECSPSKAIDCQSYLIEDDGGSDDEVGSFIAFIEPVDDYGYVSESSGGYLFGGSMGGTGGYGSATTGGYYGGESGGGDYCGGHYVDGVGESCMNIVIDGLVRFNSYEYYGYYGGGGGMCEETSSEVIPPHAWAASIATCRIPEAAPACDDGVCLPAIPEGFESKWCIYQQGDLECPAGFADKTVYWSDIDDSRKCTSCQCGTFSSCEEADMLVFAEEDCAGEPVAVVPANAKECTQVTGLSMIGDFGGEDCPVTKAAVPEGTIEPTGPFTFCCDG